MITLARAIRRIGVHADSATAKELRENYKARRIRMREKLAIEKANKGSHRRSRNRRKADKQTTSAPTRGRK